jgi:hypothetical protein
VCPVTKRLSWVVVMVLGAGCVFTPRPMIPLTDDAGGGFTGLGDSAVTGTPSADAGPTYSSDASASDAPPGPFDSECRRAGDAGDSGYIDRDGQPCDPSAPRADGGARDVPDASCDAGDASDATDGEACDGGPATGQAVGRR